jgi:hypothetical protein
MMENCLAFGCVGENFGEKLHCFGAVPSRAPYFGEISNSVGSITVGNCTFKGVSIPRALQSDRKSSTVAGANPE